MRCSNSPKIRVRRHRNRDVLAPVILTSARPRLVTGIQGVLRTKLQGNTALKLANWNFYSFVCIFPRLYRGRVFLRTNLSAKLFHGQGCSFLCPFQKLWSDSGGTSTHTESVGLANVNLLTPSKKDYFASLNLNVIGDETGVSNFIAVEKSHFQ